MKNILKFVVLFGFVVILIIGCVVNWVIGSVDLLINLLVFKIMYVKKILEDNGGINVLIVDKLCSKGVIVMIGMEVLFSNVDVVVIYIDKWMWDIMMYMFELIIIFCDLKIDFLMVIGNLYYILLICLFLKEMVNEVVDNIYKGSK